MHILIVFGCVKHLFLPFSLVRRILDPGLLRILPRKIFLKGKLLRVTVLIGPQFSSLM